jgi:hypothetical protein
MTLQRKTDKARAEQIQIPLADKQAQTRLSMLTSKAWMVASLVNGIIYEQEGQEETYCADNDKEDKDIWGLPKMFASRTITQMDDWLTETPCRSRCNAGNGEQTHE